VPVAVADYCLPSWVCDGNSIARDYLNADSTATKKGDKKYRLFLKIK
jgi:hypothetical protein